jgi:hypothetical protein
MNVLKVMAKSVKVWYYSCNDCLVRGTETQ